MMRILCAMIALGLLEALFARDLLAEEQASSAAVEAAKVLATEVCSVCHGPGGRSTFSTTPNLAAQRRPYLIGKIKLFRDRALAKQDSHFNVLGLALLDDPTVEALARYFASQPPPAPVADNPVLIAAGNKIFVQGAPEHSVPACAVCHGATGTGFGIFPRLAGQHAEYVQRQLELIKSQLRDAPVMHGIIKDMTADEMKAVAAFVQSK